jgi:hypothetical protein
LQLCFRCSLHSSFWWSAALVSLTSHLLWIHFYYFIVL